ncbi:MAG: neuraminidase (sialidase)-like protein [Acidobacteria bacterium]|nr:neuraminidase (sialidase)-like protein [Acidobacteriota bacterium]
MRLEALTILAAAALSAAPPLHEAELVFPLEKWHNHSSSIVEQPNGDLFLCWFHGSGERQADDVKIEGARWIQSKRAWSDRFTLADSPGFPDTNGTVFIDNRQRLWLFWPVILANQWETALMKYKRSSDYQFESGAPKWEWSDNILMIPKRMHERTQELLEKDLGPNPIGQRAARLIALSADKYFSRLGWFTRTHPITLPSGRILVPMYSDGYSFGIMGISDDNGETWFSSEPIVGYGGIQPSVVRRKDGTLVAYLRDNGPPPKRIQMSVSSDEGISWSKTTDTELFNPGASVEALALRDGRWIMVYNDLERDRHSLAVSMSDDEGKTWKWKRHLERDATPMGRYHYPSVMQARDGSIHVSYSYHRNMDGQEGKAIKHARINTEWIEQGGR